MTAVRLLQFSTLFAHSDYSNWSIHPPRLPIGLPFIISTKERLMQPVLWRAVGQGSALSLKNLKIVQSVDLLITNLFLGAEARQF